MSFSVATHRDHCRLVSVEELQSERPTGPCLSVRRPPADPVTVRNSFALQPDGTVIQLAGALPPFQGAMLARIDRGTLIPPYSQLGDGSTVLWDPYYQWGGDESARQIFQTISDFYARAPAREFVPGAHVALARHCDTNWGHWLIEMVPSLAWVEDLPALAEARIVVPAALSATQRELLAAVGVAEDRLFFQPADGRAYAFERLYWPSPAFHVGIMSPHVAGWLKDKLFKAYGAPDRARRRRLYISRRDTGRRRIRNEDELVARLVAEGFEIVIPSETSLAEQVELFGSADIVMGPHGAGLSNILLCEKDTLLVDLNESDGWFMTAAGWFDLVYGAVRRRGIDYDPATEDESVVVDDVLRFTDWLLRRRAG